MGLKKSVTDNEREAIDAYLQLQRYRNMPTTFVAFQSFDLGEPESNARRVQIHTGHTENMTEQVEVFLSNRNGRWRAWKLVYEYKVQTYHEQTHASHFQLTTQGWVARKKESSWRSLYEYAPAPVDLQVDADHKVYFREQVIA